MRSLRAGTYSKWLPEKIGFEEIKDRPPRILDFELGEILGKGKKSSKGSFGKVYFARSKQSGTSYALKIMEKMSIEAEKAEEQCIIEINLMERLHHPNVLGLQGYFEDAKFIYLVVELADRLSLNSMILQRKGIEEEEASRYLFQIVSGIHYLHKQSPPIIHRDIKPENIVMVQGVCKVADFGSANTKDKIKKDTMCGTPEYLAPEMILKKGHDEKVDMWAFGILAFEIVSGYSPFFEFIADAKGSTTEIFNKLTTAILVFLIH